MSKLRVRPVQFDVDADALAQLYAATSRWHANQWPADIRLPDLSTLAAELATMDDDDMTCHLVADSDGSVVGLVAGRVVEPPTEGMARYAGRILRVHDIVVAEASRRHGVGRALLATIEEWARERGQ
jgi:GNAT superfamily N-acetyltransferase